MVDLDTLEILAMQATPRPWYCTRTIQEELGIKPFDWGTIMLKPREGKGFAPILAKLNMNFATEEEQSAERKRSLGEERETVRDPGQPGRDAEYIVAACNVLPDLIAENRTLRSRAAEYSGELAVLYGCKRDLEKKVQELERQNTFFLKSLKENHICPYSYCKYDVGSELDEWECAATDSRECWIQAAKEAADDD